MVDAGKLNRRIVVKYLNSGQDSAGQPVLTWTTLATLWAHIRFSSGLESIKGGQDVSVAKCSVRVRLRTDITAAMRVYLGSTVYEIKSILPDEEHKWHMDLVCEAVSG
jgi:SPP1 family predicted phage head-tail adaptor